MKLKKLEVRAFAGISPNSPVIIDFSESKFIKVSGDEGVGKTSLIKALLVACGNLSHTGKEGKDLINLDSDKIDINFSFTGTDKYNYEVRCTKSQFSLTYEGESIPEPLTQMKKLLGIVGVSPMEIKFKPLKEIVKWLAGYSNKSAEEFEKQLTKYKDSIKVAIDTRADANRSLKGLREYLNNEPLYLDWEGSEKKFTKDVDIKTLSAKLTIAGNKSDKLIQAEEKLGQLAGRKNSLQEQILKLQEELALVEKSITNGEKFIEENKHARKEYDTIKKQYDTAAQDAVNFQKWQDIKRKTDEMQSFESIAQKADAKEKNLLQEIKVLQAEILPDIKNVELVITDTHENGKIRKEGLYFQGKNFAQLSESETWDIVLEIWRRYKVRVVVIDNFSSLGSMAVAILNKLVKEGAYVLASEMSRETKVLTIEYN